MKGGAGEGLDALYNPALMAEHAIGLSRSLRRPFAQRLLSSLRRIGQNGAPQHQLVLGARGSGKTMLLRTLRQAILDDEALAKQWLPLTFPEAQWDVARPSDLWENALDYLMVALERAHPIAGRADAKRIADAIAALPDDEDTRQRASLRLLVSESERIGRRFILMIDTLDVVLDRLKKDQWHIREVLSAEPRLLVIGTSARAIEATYRYDAAFYDFFQIHELRPLPRPTLIDTIAQLEGGPLREPLLAFAATAPAELEACFDLLGTQPRVLAQIARAYTQLAGTPDLASRVVLTVLDALTPWMMARMEALAPQSQMVVHALATLWHPSRPQEVAQRTRLSPNIVSAQLHRLTQDGVVEKVPLPPGQRHGVILSDRSMSVWLLMRLGQPHRRRLVAACAGLVRAHAGQEPTIDGLFADDWRATHAAPLHREFESLDPNDQRARIAPELTKLVEPRRLPYTAARND